MVQKEFLNDENQLLAFPKALYYKIREIISLDKRSLALLRVGLAFCVLWDLVNRARDLSTFYSDVGIMNRSLVLSHFTTDYWSSLHMFSGDPFLVGVLFFIHGILAFLFMIGYKTTLMTCLNWYFCTSLQTRNIIVFHSGDNVLRMALFWSCFLPLGECFSVDAAFREQKQKKRKEDYAVFSIASFALTFQLMIMYYVAQRHKTASQWREEGIAAWMALQIDFFQRPFARFMMEVPYLLKLSTFGVLKWQKFGPLFFFSPILTGPMRTFGVLGFSCMHWGFFLPMRLGLFGWGPICAILGLLPAWFWDSLFLPFFWTKKRRDFRLYYLQDCQICTNVAKLVSTFLLLPGTQVIPIGDGETAPSNNASKFNRSETESTQDETAIDIPKPRLQFKDTWIIAEDCHGNLHRNWDAFVAISDVSVLIWLLKPVLKKSKCIAVEIMELVHEHGPSRPAHLNLTKKRSVKQFSEASHIIKNALNITYWILFEILVGILLYTLFTVNASAAGYPQYNTPNSLNSLSWALHFPQNWGMFSPRPPDNMWWYNIKGELDNGTFVELFTNGGLHSWQIAPYEYRHKPADMIIAFKNHRWFKFFEVGLNYHRSADQLRLAFGRWICREFNKRYSGTQALYKHEIILVNERVDLQKLDGSRIPSGESSLWKHMCYYKPVKNYIHFLLFNFKYFFLKRAINKIKTFQEKKELMNAVP